MENKYIVWRRHKKAVEGDLIFFAVLGVFCLAIYVIGNWG